MNERIKELMRQSMIEYQFDLRFSPEKFAELIVKECRAMAIQKLAIGSDKYTESHNGALWSVINEIDEHFGVKE